MKSRLSSVYTESITRHPVVSREEAIELARRAKAGDLAARDRLIAANLRLVVKIANEYQFRHDLEDIVQHGNIGLLRALKRFDPERGFAFTTYAVWWIRAEILLFISKQGGAVDLKHTSQRRKVIFHGKRTPEQAGEAVGLPASEVRLLVNAMAAPISLETRIGESNQRTLLDILADDRPSPEDELATRGQSRGFRVAIERYIRLNDREEAILARRLLCDNPETLDDLAADWKVTRQRVQQIEARLIKRLRWACGEAGLVPRSAGPKHRDWRYEFRKLRAA